MWHPPDHYCGLLAQVPPDDRGDQQEVSAGGSEEKNADITGERVSPAQRAIPRRPPDLCAQLEHSRFDGLHRAEATSGRRDGQLGFRNFECMATTGVYFFATFAFETLMVDRPSSFQQEQVEGPVCVEPSKTFTVAACDEDTLRERAGEILKTNTIFAHMDHVHTQYTCQTETRRLATNFKVSFSSRIPPLQLSLPHPTTTNNR